MKLVIKYPNEARKYEITIKGLEEKEINGIEKEVTHLIKEGSILDKIHPNPFVEAFRFFLSYLNTNDIKLVIGGGKD